MFTFLPKFGNIIHLFDTFKCKLCGNLCDHTVYMAYDYAFCCKYHRTYWLFTKSLFDFFS